MQQGQVQGMIVKEEASLEKTCSFATSMPDFKKDRIEVPIIRRPFVVCHWLLGFSISND